MRTAIPRPVSDAGGPAAGRPRLRVVPAPESSPPVRDVELPRSGPDPFVQGTLALDYLLPSGLPAVPEVTPDLRLLPSRRPGYSGLVLGPDGDPADIDGPQPTGTDRLPDPRLWAARLGQAVVEVAAAGRPVTQLARWTSGPVYEALVDCYAPRARRPVSRRRVMVDERVRSVHLCQPADGVAEASLLLHGGSRPRALALRLEGWDGRWVCTVCEWV